MRFPLEKEKTVVRLSLLKEIDHCIEQANSYHPTIKFTAELSELETTFLDTTVYKGERFEKESILDVRTHYKPTERFQYKNYNSCHPAGVKKGFVKGEALRLLRTNSSKVVFEENIKKKYAWHREVILVTWWTSPKLTLQRERTLLHKNRKRTRKFYPS